MCLEQRQVVLVLSSVSERRGRHDIRRRIETCAGCEQVVENPPIFDGIESSPRGGAETVHHGVPGGDTIEKPEEQCTEENLFRLLSTLVEDVSNEVLTHAIGGSIYVGEAVASENGVLGPGGCFAADASVEHLLPGRCKPPIRIEHERCSEYTAAAYRNVSCLMAHGTFFLRGLTEEGDNVGSRVPESWSHLEEQGDATARLRVARLDGGTSP